MLGNGKEGFRYSVQDGIAQEHRYSCEKQQARFGGTGQYAKDQAIPSDYNPNQCNETLNMTALPAQGFVYVTRDYYLKGKDRYN
jgi:hypothetical protein